MLQWCCGNYVGMGNCLIYGKGSVNVNYYMITLHATHGLFYFQ